jgi:hypothetical protein
MRVPFTMGLPPSISWSTTIRVYIAASPAATFFTACKSEIGLAGLFSRRKFTAGTESPQAVFRHENRRTREYHAYGV